MKRYSNANHKVQPFAQRVSGLDKLAFSNRESSNSHIASSLSESDNRALNDYMKKVAKAINHQLIEQVASLDKVAMVTNDYDLVMQATGLVQSKLGVDPQNSQNLVSNLLRKTMKIQEVYGGEAETILRRLIEELQNGMAERRTEDAVGEAQMNLGSAFKYKKTEEQVKFAVMKDLMMTSSDAERLTKSILTEARDLLIPLRPFELRDICLAIIQLIQQYDDATIVYGIRNNQELIRQLEMQLTRG